MCSTGKQTFPSPQDANRTLRLMISHNSHSHASVRSWSRGKATAYKCCFCGLWHIGHGAPKRSVRRHG